MAKKYTLTLQSLQQQQSVSREELQVDKSEIIKEYDRLVDGPAARQWLEKERPSWWLHATRRSSSSGGKNSRKKLLKSHTGSPGCAGR